MEIELKENEGLGYCIDDETFNLSDAKTLDERKRIEHWQNLLSKLVIVKQKSNE